MGWLPITEAPKDGHELVVAEVGSPPQFARWVESHLYTDGGFWQNRDGRHRETPTHFFELPQVAD